MKIIFQIDGGVGKSIVATAVCKAIKKQYPNDKLIVISGYPEVFICNPNVDKAFSFNNLSYFYEDNIENQQFKTFLHNPYFENDFIRCNGHLIKVWCDMFGIKYNGEQPELFITDREKTFYTNMFLGKKLFDPQKPIFLIQTNGGAKEQTNKYSWPRDLPIAAAQQVVNAFSKDYNIIHIRRDDQLQLQGAIPVTADFRALALLISISAKRLFIDSFSQHAAAALGKPSVVCWIGNTPNQFGYELHNNIIANPPTLKPELRNSVFSKYNISGTPTEFPYRHEGEIFNVKQIIEAMIGDNYEGKSPAVKNIHIKEKILLENNRQSMVARRLKHLAGNVDLSNVKQIVDVGSWHLVQSIEFSNVFPTAIIDAFEPVPDSYQLCISNHNKLENGRKDRIRVHNIALSNEPGEVPFYVVEKGTHKNIDEGFSSMFKFNEEFGITGNGDHSLQKEIQVNADTLDNWCSTNKITEVDILWMDAQGSELLVLQGAEKTLRNTKIIMTEVGLKPYYEGHTLKPDIDAYLEGHGFKELKSSFELNGFDYEANTIYIRDN